jgi:hypothetical protein
MSCRDALWADLDTEGRIQPTPSEGRHSWHYDTLSSPHLPSDPLTINNDYGPAGAAGAWAPPPHLPEPQDLQGQRAGRSNGRRRRIRRRRITFSGTTGRME